jgi:hypothetical protein
VSLIVDGSTDLLELQADLRAVKERQSRGEAELAAVKLRLSKVLVLAQQIQSANDTLINELGEILYGPSNERH